jgi:hypothetical protein
MSPYAGERCHNLSVTEDMVLSMLRASGLSLAARDDGYYDIFDGDGDQVALLGWCVEQDQRNDRGGEIGSPYPLTFDEIESIVM